MTYILSGGGRAPVFIDTLSPECLGVKIGAMIDAQKASASAAHPTANLAFYYPFVLTESVTVRKLFIHNGATASGNVDVGIYDGSGTRKVSSGSTAQTGTSVIQEFDVADTALTPGRYYLAYALDNNTGTFVRWNPTTGGSGAVPQAKFFAIQQEASAFALPATATFADPASIYIAYLGLSLRTQVD